ncbi:rod shape-determining protein MreC [Ferrovibrio sp.]|uniref:rod shape-determining protein MreC n=1 Tax=Ferrovibrio sp. TaxID=1917215 RepID=UPI0025B7CC90|nr:rod shape-determining protein MreC [Ferrovibrio sp.]
MRLAAPIKGLVQRFAFLLLIGAALGLILLSRIDRPAVERVRAITADIFEPMLTAVSQPIAFIGNIVGTIDDLIFAHEENVRLRTENARLLQWQDVARRLEQDNASLRRLLAAGPDLGHSFVTGRVIADGGGLFVRTALINIGSKDGVKKGQATIGEGGYVGRVAEVGQRAARILLLTDLNSRLPVMIQETGHRAVLAGDNSPQPKLEYLHAGAKPQVGQMVVTSGDGGQFPVGIPVGEIVAVGEGNVRLRPFVELGRLDFLRVVQFEETRLEAEEAARPAARKP